MNIPLLKAKVVENELTLDGLAKRINLSRSTFYSRIKSNGEDFTVREVEKMIKNLSLGKDEIIKIFFQTRVPKMRFPNRLIDEIEN